ncbi:hypothetical protein BCV70DRAFT_105799 [Testicularia cyperi]|uniref:Uncharacterized protein n=1 Tax=Testicularia cyperi TaxID=1882483 RepID=A0A317XQK0_9BASI|nr:hypothetical protein BCV70DRAFT_105799 [Testicularia cyperi]
MQTSFENDTAATRVVTVLRSRGTMPCPLFSNACAPPRPSCAFPNRLRFIFFSLLVEQWRWSYRCHLALGSSLGCCRRCRWRRSSMIPALVGSSRAQRKFPLCTKAEQGPSFLADQFFALLCRSRATRICPIQMVFWRICWFVCVVGELFSPSF